MTRSSPRKSLTQETLKTFLHYDPDTGPFTRLLNSGTAKAGDLAGGLDAQGYVLIGVDGRQYLANRLAWLWVHGEWPENHTDHIDGDRANNRIRNLRKATSAQNVNNAAKRRRNTSGIKGVYWSSIRRKWVAQIGLNGSVKNLGGFANKDDAARAREAAEIEHHREFRYQGSEKSL